MELANAQDKKKSKRFSSERKPLIFSTLPNNSSERNQSTDDTVMIQ